MKHLDQYPILTAEPLKQRENEPKIFLFNSQTKKGFAVEGLASVLCRRFNGKKTLRDLIVELEKDFDLQSNTFEKEINEFIQSLMDNSLVEFKSEKQG